MFMNVHHLYYLLFLPFHFFVLKQMWCKLGRENSFCFPSLIIKDSMRKLMSMLIFPLGGPRQKAGTHHLKKLLCMLIWRHFVFSLILFLEIFPLIFCRQWVEILSSQPIFNNGNYQNYRWYLEWASALLFLRNI